MTQQNLLTNLFAKDLCVDKRVYFDLENENFFFQQHYQMVALNDHSIKNESDGQIYINISDVIVHPGKGQLQKTET